MKRGANDQTIYEISIEDVQEVSNHVLERSLTKKELALVTASVGDYIDWFQAIEHAIHNQIRT